MTYRMGVEVRNSAWVTWRKFDVQADSDEAAVAETMEECKRRTPFWTHEHDDYCPQDWVFKVIGVVPA